MHALAMADDANREPGAPIGKDEIDPDLIRLPRGALQVGIIAAAGVLILCVALLVRLRHDVGYARESDTPKPVTAADIVAGKIGDNRYVTLEAPPDRAGAVRLRTTKGSDGHRVVAVRGTGDRLWLALPGDAWDHEAQHDDRVSGRLRRLADVRYAGPLARALAAYPSPRFITGAELRRARTSNATEVTLIDGATLTLGADADVDLSVVDPNATIVVAALSEGHPTTAAWGEALAAAGVIAPGQAPIASTADLARWEVRRPDAVAAVQAILDQAQLAGARADAASTNLRARFAALAVTDAGVTGPAGVIPWSAIDVAAVWAPRPVPAGAWVVLADERPGDYWYMPPVFVGLVLIGALALWALVRAARRQFFDQSGLAR
ncbi:MAG: hypothetical protein JNK64_09590 [Myxococcales bacterium]|nr:hypothetical protein [Myxococcales bacterium]